jgi:hypothetical protein
MDALFGIIGVILGFLLGAFYQEFREKDTRKRLCAQLREELKANMYAIPHRKATIRSMLLALKERRILPGESVPFCDAIFAHHYQTVAPFLSQKERNILQVVYANLAAVDRTMAAFEPAVTAAGSGDAQERVMIAFAHKLGDLLPALDEQENLMKSFCANDPIDVFHMDMAYEDLKRADIRKG